MTQKEPLVRSLLGLVRVLILLYPNFSLEGGEEASMTKGQLSFLEGLGERSA